MSDALFAGLAARFRVRAKGDAERLRAALAASDHAAVAAIAHALSGTGGTLGFAAISEQAAALETAAEEGSKYWDDSAIPLLAALDAL